MQSTEEAGRLCTERGGRVLRPWTATDWILGGSDITENRSSTLVKAEW